jgi:prepilin-type processing-associated H-X9-DG protein
MKLALGLLIGAALLYFIADILICPYCNRKDSSRATACLSNTKQQVTALLIYASEHDERFAPRDYWMGAIAPYVHDRDVFHHAGPPPRGLGYAFNAALSDAKAPPKPETVPITYDSVNLARNASDLFASLPHPGRHGGKNSIAYADGHARRVVVKAP